MRHSNLLPRFLRKWIDRIIIRCDLDNAFNLEHNHEIRAAELKVRDLLALVYFADSIQTSHKIVRFVTIVLQSREANATASPIQLVTGLHQARKCLP